MLLKMYFTTNRWMKKLVFRYTVNNMVYNAFYTNTQHFKHAVLGRTYYK